MEIYRQRFDRSREAGRERASGIVRGIAPGWGDVRRDQDHPSVTGGKEVNNKQYIFCNGIMNNPEDVEAWTDRAVQWINKNTSYKADKMEYRAGTITRRFFQGQRVKNLQKICKAYPGERLILVGHSNGCDIIQRLIKKGMPRVHEIHLIAAASEADFNKNGFNHALSVGTLNKVFVYMSPIDEALKKAQWSTKLFGWLGLGYGFLGLVGPQKINQKIIGKVTVFKENMSHSQWFSKKHFENTMKLISGET